jgi:hypothetical protein
LAALSVGLKSAPQISSDQRTQFFGKLPGEQTLEMASGGFDFLGLDDDILYRLVLRSNIQ